MTHQKNIITAGRPITEAKKALIMIHGRGGSARDIITLAPHLNVKDYTIIAPQATGNTWYPQSFLAPPAENEPWLSNALDVLSEVVNDTVAAGISKENIYFLGFSQGACLTLEFTTRNADKYGGVVAFTGGLIGDHIYQENYKGNFNNTPVYIGSSDPDFHVPVARVHESAELLKKMGADVTATIYPQMGHTITVDELKEANRLVFK
ncbi:phospholipase/carboxylesterase [Chitinophaga jiangningensis]|uniref:Phospholipase/carboxylesterase n=1 Tax=Chitinophaga jiangningensis TaxID=1419482 RepID=A0A1M7J5D0_9BACT|nr:dienelactone hydrolase family protein [Chitinophaga jiangningensis]SHM48128.1 phospholipase/carboxylesterase [Chitinophaga jiangningensis]